MTDTNRRFLSLAELNETIFERLYLFNHKPFQKKDGSRASEFEEEKPFLLPLPKRPFELSEWKVATVAPNYHISVDKQNYSVPYEYIKQKVDVRITRSTVEVFFGGKRMDIPQEQPSKTAYQAGKICRARRLC